MKLVQVEEQITEARVEEIKASVANKTMTKGAAIREMFVGGMETKDIANKLGIRYNHAYNVIKNEVLIHGLEVETESRGGENSKKAQIIQGLQDGKSIKESRVKRVVTRSRSLRRLQCKDQCAEPTDKALGG